MRKQFIFLLCAALALLLNPAAHAIEAGRVAPNCKFTPVGGGPGLDLRQYKGKVVYVDFWASWCAPCARSFPFMNQLERELRGRGLEVVGVNLDENPADAKEFLAQHPSDITVLADANGHCAQDFGVQAMPSSFLVDRNGVVRHVHLGFRPGEAEKFRALAEQLLAESPTAP